MTSQVKFSEDPHINDTLLVRPVIVPGTKQTESVIYIFRLISLVPGSGLQAPFACVI